MNHPPQVAVVIRPFHELGLSLCRMMAMEGTRIVVLDRDPNVGEAFCQRLGLEGFSASFRYIDPDFRSGEIGLRDDLSDVYGQVRALITFYEPVVHERRINWLDLSSQAGTKLISQAFDWRLRLLKALTPLLGMGEGGLVINVLMGLRESAGSQQRPDALVASLLNDLLAADWAAAGVRVRHIATEVGGYTPGARDEEIDQLNKDLARVLELVETGREAARS